MTGIDYSDQWGLFDPREWADQVHIVGIGGIGSAVLLPLAKLGVQEIHLWDDDTVEPHNVPAQLIYRASDVGSSKVDAAKAFIDSFGLDLEVVVHPERVTPRTELEGVVMSCVDSMRSRDDVWQAVRLNAGISFYLDGRIGGENVQLFSFDPNSHGDIGSYESLLFTDDKALPLPCAARTVIHPAVQVATWMITNLTLFARGDGYPKIRLGNLGADFG